MIASVSGRRISAQVPSPGSEVSVTSPPSSRIATRTASMPTPRPEMSVVVSEVEKPGWKSSSVARARSIVSVSPIRPRSRAFSATRSASMPRPSSLTEMTTLPPA